MMMNAVYVVLILLQAALIFYFIWRSKKRTASTSPEPVDLSGYTARRNVSVSISPAQLKLNIPPQVLMVYGVVMDWDMGEVTLTLAAYITGAANMYFTTGEDSTGGGKDPRVGEAAVAFVTEAQQHINRTVRVTGFDLPAAGCVRFQLLTNHGVYAAQEEVSEFKGTESVWFPLFKKGSEVAALMPHSNKETIPHQ